MALGTMGPARLPVAQRPQPGNLRYGLFNVAPPQVLINDDDGQNIADHAYGGGFTYDPIGCGEAHLYEINCDPPVAKTFDDNSAEIEVSPFVVYASLKCGPRGMSPLFMADKTSLRLYSSEQHAVEDAFWSGAGGGGPALVDAVLPVDVGTGGTFANIVDAVAALEAHAYGAVPYGYHAVMHATSAVHAYAAESHLVHTAAEGFAAVWGTTGDDRTLRTSLGTRWVFGGGYPGTGPAGLAPPAGETFIWITGNVGVWRQAEFSPPDPLRTQFDRTLNEFRLVAERGYLATYECFAAYASVSIPKVAVP